MKIDEARALKHMVDRAWLALSNLSAQLRKMSMKAAGVQPRSAETHNGNGNGNGHAVERTKKPESRQSILDRQLIAVLRFPPKLRDKLVKDGIRTIGDLAKRLELGTFNRGGEYRKQELDMIDRKIEAFNADMEDALDGFDDHE